MADHANDIDALLSMLWRDGRDKYHSAVTALVAERNKLVEDNASQTYKGNSVRYWHDKASAYKATIGSLWEILESAAVRPDGERTITAVLTALVAERNKAKADFVDAWRERSEFAKRIDEADAALAAAIKQRDGYRSALERIANEDYRGNRSKESQIAFDALAAADAARDAMRKGATDAK